MCPGTYENGRCKELPSDLLEAGSFEDTEPKSGHEEEDEVAAIALTHRLNRSLEVLAK